MAVPGQLPFAPQGGKFALMKQSAQVAWPPNVAALDLNLENKSVS